MFRVDICILASMFLLDVSQFFCGIVIKSEIQSKPAVLEDHLPIKTIFLVSLGWSFIDRFSLYNHPLFVLISVLILKCLVNSASFSS